MYPDHSLMPKEAIRLAALGLLAEGPRRYGDLAGEVRDFIGHVMGPNLDLMGTSIQMLCVEGLARAGREKKAGDPIGGGVVGADDRIAITEAGLKVLDELLLASIRSPFNDVNKLVLALKMRFFSRLDADQRAQQIALVTAALEVEVARLDALRRQQAEKAGDNDALVAWLDHDLGQLRDSLDWFARLAS